MGLFVFWASGLSLESFLKQKENHWKKLKMNYLKNEELFQSFYEKVFRDFEHHDDHDPCETIVWAGYSL